MILSSRSGFMHVVDVSSQLDSLVRLQSPLSSIGNSPRDWSSRQLAKTHLPLRDFDTPDVNNPGNWPDVSALWSASCSVYCSALTADRLGILQPSECDA